MPSENSDAKPSRRAFLIRYAGAAFAAPVIASFALDGVAQASEKHNHKHRQGHPNQSYPNQSHPNQCLPNQSLPNQTIGDSAS
jgi:hypothetical protein